jgi:trimeric autotransporter adhesin
MVNLSANLIGLSVLTGQDAFSAVGALPTFESKAVKAAKAQFTTAITAPPWKDKDGNATSSQLTSILAARTLIQPSTSDSSGNLLPDDVKTSFTAFKALDKLRVLAEAAADKTTSDAQRAQYQKAFAKGMADLQTYLASSPSDKVNLAFGKATTTVKTSELAASDLYETNGKGLVKMASDPLPGLTGNEQFVLNIKRGTQSQSFTVDLSTGPQPPTINSVAEALNAQIKSVLVYDDDGSVMTNSKGEPVSKWNARFQPELADGMWRLNLETPDGIEQVSLDQVGAKDSLVVTTGETPLDSPTSTQVFRLNDPTGENSKVNMGTIEALDRQGTAQNVVAGKTTSVTTAVEDADGKVKLQTTKTSDVYASTTAAASVTDAEGFTYVVGTTKGDLGANLSTGNDNLFLTKMDSAGKVVWQRNLGATGDATGASVSLGQDGSVVVAGTVTGSFNGITADGDMAVAKYAANGDEQFSTLVVSKDADTARAVTVGADGSVFVAGRVSNEDGGDAMVVRIDATGRIAERRTIDSGGSDTITSLATDKDGNLLALVSSQGVASVVKMQADSLSTTLGSISLGTADARALAVGADGSIAVGGATSTAIAGTQANALSGGRDGFVTRIDSALSSASTTYVGTGEDDQIDSVAFMGDQIYAGGRTTGDLGATRRGPVDGFVTQIDAATGTVGTTTQFGQILTRTEPVRVAADPGGSNALSALGFGRGVLNPTVSDRVTTQTTLREGDYFSIKADDLAVRRLTIEKGDTLKTVAERLQGMIGASKGTVTATTVDGTQYLRITMKQGHEMELLAGSAGSDALSKLGLEPQRIANAAAVVGTAPKVKPGGAYGLELTGALSLASVDNAKAALGKIKDAISMTQTAYRSLYWDDGKATIVDASSPTKSGKKGASTAVEQAQLKNYQAALSRLQSSSTSTAATLLGF